MSEFIHTKLHYRQLFFLKYHSALEVVQCPPYILAGL